MVLSVEYTVEPFQPGSPGPHVQAAHAAARSRSFRIEEGPFGSRIEGDDQAVVEALGAIVGEAMAAGASRISLQVVRPEPPD